MIGALVLTGVLHSLNSPLSPLEALRVLTKTIQRPHKTSLKVPIHSPTPTPLAVSPRHKAESYTFQFMNTSIINCQIL